MTTFAPVFAPGDFYAYKLSRYCAEEEEEEEEEEECKNCSKKCRLFGEHLKESDAKKQKAKRKNEIPTNVSLTLEREKKKGRMTSTRLKLHTCVYGLTLLLLLLLLLLLSLSLQSVQRDVTTLQRAASFQQSFQSRQEAAALIPVLGSHFHVDRIGGRPVASRSRVAEFHKFLFHGCGDLLLI